MESSSTDLPLSDIRRLMLKLDLPAQNDERLNAILRVCGDRFSTALSAAANGDQASGAAKDFLSLVLRGITPNVENAIKSLGIEVPPVEVLLKASLAEGPGFRKALHEASSNGNTPTEARAYVEAILKKHAMQSSYVQPVREYRSVTVYGRQTALCVNADKNRAGEQVIRLEGATKSNTEFDWKEKIGVQLSVGECVLLVAMLTGKISEKLAFSGHGSRHDKWASIELQAGHFFVTVGQRARSPIGVQITAVDLYPVTSLLWRQLQCNDSHLDLPEIRNSVSLSAKLFNEAATRKTTHAA